MLTREVFFAVCSPLLILTFWHKCGIIEGYMCLISVSTFFSYASSFFYADGAIASRLFGCFFLSEDMANAINEIDN